MSAGARRKLACHSEPVEERARLPARRSFFSEGGAVEVSIEPQYCAL